MTLLQRVRQEVRRRAAPPTAAQVLLGYLRSDELRVLRAALAESVDTETVARLESRARTRRRIGVTPFFDRRTGRTGPEYACVRGHGPTYCTCLDEALDSGKRIATVKGLRFQATRIHDRRHPPPRPEPWAEPERPLARVLPFRRRAKAEPTAPAEPEPAELDAALADRAPLESLDELGTLLGVGLMPVPHERGF